ncbi:MAG: hypothetical protein P4L45_17430 [Ignavibacteriaceae bacterium]|nr:hypothetical protein [Ignavibacteriaceae bacterium]
MKFVTLNTSLWEQNHHQFNKADDAPHKNIKLSALLNKSKIVKISTVHLLEVGYDIALLLPECYKVMW